MYDRVTVLAKNNTQIDDQVQVNELLMEYNITWIESLKGSKLHERMQVTGNTHVNHGYIYTPIQSSQSFSSSSLLSSSSSLMSSSWSSNRNKHHTTTSQYNVFGTESNDDIGNTIDPTSIRDTDGTLRNNDGGTVRVTLLPHSQYLRRCHSLPERKGTSAAAVSQVWAKMANATVMHW